MNKFKVGDAVICLVKPIPNAPDLGPYNIHRVSNITQTATKLFLIQLEGVVYYFYSNELRKIPNKTATASHQAISEMLCSFPEHLRRTITYDNGSENVDHLLGF